MTSPKCQVHNVTEENQMEPSLRGSYDGNTGEHYEQQLHASLCALRHICIQSHQDCVKQDQKIKCNFMPNFIQYKYKLTIIQCLELSSTSLTTRARTSVEFGLSCSISSTTFRQSSTFASYTKSIQVWDYQTGRGSSKLATSLTPNPTHSDRHRDRPSYYLWQRWRGSCAMNKC